jgi:hypothetical protein
LSITIRETPSRIAKIYKPVNNFGAGSEAFLRSVIPPKAGILAKTTAFAGVTRIERSELRAIIPERD